MAGVPAPPIITCPQWNARPPKHAPTLTGRPVRAIFHHTAGHAPAVDTGDLSGRDAAVNYAHMLQADMMERRGWSDSGHNFLVMRSGLIVQGRWGSVTAIEHGRMVVSAHCPGQNDQPGVEHEHVDGEALTPKQHTMSVLLHAWIFDRCGIRPTEIYGHRHFYPTACPGTLDGSIAQLRLDVARHLTELGRGGVGRAGLLVRARFAAGRPGIA